MSQKSSSRRVSANSVAAIWIDTAITPAQALIACRSPLRLATVTRRGLARSAVRAEQDAAAEAPDAAT